MDDKMNIKWWEENDLKSRFMAASLDYEETKLVLYGAPMDYTVSFRPGSRFGPKSIREVSEAVEEYSFYQDKDLRNIHFFDAGDLYLPFGNVSKSLDLIKEATFNIHRDGKIPLMLGGEHLVSWPAINYLADQYPDLLVIHLDAHTDLREAYFGEAFSHASVIRLAADKLGPGRVYQFGIRSGDKPDFEYARTHTRLYPEELLTPFNSCIADFKGKPVYVTIDIDVLDPAFAPGTGTPESGGIFPKELFGFIKQLAGLKVVGADLVEIAPAYDQTGATPVLGAKIVRELILSMIK